MTRKVVVCLEVGPSAVFVIINGPSGAFAFDTSRRAMMIYDAQKIYDAPRETSVSAPVSCFLQQSTIFITLFDLSLVYDLV